MVEARLEGKMTGVAVDLAEAHPPRFAAVTRTRIRERASRGLSAYEEPVARAILTQLWPLRPQRSHL